MTSAADIARHLGGKSVDNYYVARCPVSGHGNGRGDRNPSLLIKDGNSTVLFRCLAGCDTRDVLAVLRQRGIIDGSAARTSPAVPQPPKMPDHKPDPAAIEIWGRASKASETIVERYLHARGITIDVPPSIRVCSSHYLDRFQLPSMVAAVQAPDRSTIAVQTTLLDPRGDRKAQVRMPRKTTGALGWGAVRLGPADGVLGIAEGVETALAAQQLVGVSVWACLGACRMPRVWVPDHVRELHIFGDNDDPGRAAAEQTAYAHRHRKVVLRFPPEGCKDWNDMLIRQARSAA